MYRFLSGLNQYPSPMHMQATSRIHFHSSFSFLSHLNTTHPHLKIASPNSSLCLLPSCQCRRDPNGCGDDDNDGISNRVPCKQPVQCGRKPPSPGYLCRMHQNTKLSTAAEDRQAYTTQSVNAAVEAAKPLVSKNEKSKLPEQSTTRSPVRRDCRLILSLLFQRENRCIPNQDSGQ